jgi:hypothetical protein
MGSKENENTKCINAPSIPFLKLEDYEHLWNTPYNLFKEFCIPGKLYSLSQLELKNKGEIFDINVLGQDDNIFENKSVEDTAALLMLFRYRDTIEKISNQENLDTKDFFNELEANREYHARALIMLSVYSKDIPIENIKTNDLNALEQEVLNVNKSTDSPYTLLFILNQLMIVMAFWEIDWLSDELFKKKYLDDIFAGKELQSHLNFLSSFKTDSVKNFNIYYPYTVLMNYSMFFPFVLHPTGEDSSVPQGQQGQQGQLAPQGQQGSQEQPVPQEQQVPGFEEKSRSDQIQRLRELANAPAEAAAEAAQADAAASLTEAASREARNNRVDASVKLAENMSRLINSGNIKGARNLSRSRNTNLARLSTPGQKKGTRKNNRNNAKRAVSATNPPPPPRVTAPVDFNNDMNNDGNTQNMLPGSLGSVGSVGSPVVPGSPTASINSAGTVNVMPTEVNYERALMGARTGKNKSISQSPSPLGITSQQGNYLSNRR